MLDNVAVIISTLNEQDTIASVIESSLKACSNVFVIDGNSTDNTAAIARKMNCTVILQKKKGKGDAITQAINEIDKDILVFIDADCSHDAVDIPKLVNPILSGSMDFVIASRYLGGSDELHGTWHNFIRMVGSSLITLGINARWGEKLTDVENGFRAIKREAALKLQLKAADFTIEQEMVMKACKLGLKIIEVASHEYERKAGVSKLPTSQGWRFIYQFLRDIW
jgi:dolichol-phosphate hexosyltransferase